MKPDVEALRNKHIKNPPEEIASEDIRLMSGDALFDMNYFLNEDDRFGDLFPHYLFFII